MARGKGLIDKGQESGEGRYALSQGTLIVYGSEPDISFLRGGKEVDTIEIKGGRDPAGALERLGAMAKSFAETSPGCANFLVAGVITPEMQKRLDAIGNVKVYLLDDLAQDGEKWDEFTRGFSIMRCGFSSIASL